MSTVNISFNKDLLRQIDKVAQEESRSRSELIREAARSYIERKRKWEQIFQIGTRLAKANRLTEADIEKEIADHRKRKQR